MTANQITTALAVSWFFWAALLCRNLRISWVPTIPILAVLGLAAAALINRWASPWGVLLPSLGLVLLFIGTLQEIFTRRSSGKK
ncbi:MAG: hypothetical protein HOW73_16830 [Polyangiaceae bacterium]|nr:hypothetical protein [Polyangiaceae bacterium]